MKQEIRNKDKVTRSNKIATARYKLNTTEQKMLYVLCSKIQPDDEVFYKHTFDIKEIADHCGLTTPARDLHKACLSISKKPISISDGNSWLVMPWLSLASYNGKTGTVELELNHNLKPYLLGLKEKFTSIKLEYLIKFNSSYSGRVYELVKSLQNQGCNKLAKPINVDELKLMFGVEKEYRFFGNLKSKVLDPALTEINTQTPDIVTYEEIKTGRKVTHIRFSITPKSPEQTNNVETNKTTTSEETIQTEPYQTTNNANDNDLYKLLQEFGISLKQIDFLTKNHSEARIKSNIEYVYNKKKTTTIGNLPAYTLKAIIDDYAGTEQQNMFTQAVEKAAKEEAAKITNEAAIAKLNNDIEERNKNATISDPNLAAFAARRGVKTF